MKYVGVDLHKQSITVCVMVKEGEQRKVERRRTLQCSDTAAIRQFFEPLGIFRVVVEATSNYEWFLSLIEDLAERCVLAHPKKLRIIAESKHKSDKIDAQVLAEFLLLDMIPEAHRPSPRLRQHRVLVRHRDAITKRIASVKCKLHHKLAFYNADSPKLFTKRRTAQASQAGMSDADRFEYQALCQQLEFFRGQLTEAEKELREFAKKASQVEREAREVLATVPQVGEVTIDVVLSEVGEARRFRSAKRIVAYAGLDPGYRKSAGKSRELPITKEGSRLLRWVLIETAWRLVNKSAHWRTLFEQLRRTTGHKKKAIVGVARRLLCVLYALLRDGKPYRLAAV
jgi:transposase